MFLLFTLRYGYVLANTLNHIAFIKVGM